MCAVHELKFLFLKMGCGMNVCERVHERKEGGTETGRERERQRDREKVARHADRGKFDEETNATSVNKNTTYWNTRRPVS